MAERNTHNAAVELVSLEIDGDGTGLDEVLAELTKDQLWYLRDRFENVYTALAAEYETRD